MADPCSHTEDPRDILIGPPPAILNPNQNPTHYRDNYINYKFDMYSIEAIGGAAAQTNQRRTEIQIHPDGMCDGVLQNNAPDNRVVGTGGCIGIQTREDCMVVRDFLLRYHGLKVMVIVGANPNP